MQTVYDLKDLQSPGTPILLFDCTLVSGDTQNWSTHGITVNSTAYSARVLQHNLFELTASTDDTDGSKLSITLANADAYFNAIERRVGWKGAQVTVSIVFVDLRSGNTLSESEVVFRGIGNPPDNSTESTLKLSFTSRLNLQRLMMPAIRIQKRCPWIFPTTTDQRTEAVDGGIKGQFSPFYRCGYSADISGGFGNLQSGAPFTSCDYTRASCVARGMFDSDMQSHNTRRFGGIEYLPPSISVRTYGQKTSHLSPIIDNEATYNDAVPLTYGTAWYNPPLIFARNDGNLTHMEVLLGASEISGVTTVVVNNIEIPLGSAGANMTATGWYNVVTTGTRTGAFDMDFVDSSGNAAGDPYGSLAVLSVVVPNSVSSGQSLPNIQVLMNGLKLARFNSTGQITDTTFTNNSAWVLLDVLLRSGWNITDFDLATFAAIAQTCDLLVSTTDLNGNTAQVPQFQCNLFLTSRRSVSDVVRGIRNGSGLYLVLATSGLVQLCLQASLAGQQPTKPLGSNSSETLNGGWPAYEFGDNAFSGILRSSNGASSLRSYSNATAQTVNHVTVEFQDEFNQYQQDSLSLIDTDDALLAIQDVSASLTALGLPNYSQALRAASLYLNESVNGNTYVQFQTSVRCVGLAPGDIITLTYSREGWSRQPFRITRIDPGLNYLTATITAQIHDDEWYQLGANGSPVVGRQGSAIIGLPRPLLGTVVDQYGNPQFGIVETSVASTDGTVTETLSVSFTPPTVASASVSIPLVSLSAQVSDTGGTLAGSQNLYYGLTALDSSGNESGLSFTVRAEILAAGNTNSVVLQNISFSSATSTFNVYRGNTPSQLLKIGAALQPVSQFTDTGLPSLTSGPPDSNYDHADFYWRIELQPEEPVDSATPTTVENSTLEMLLNDFQFGTVRVTKGTGIGQERIALSNTATTVTVSPQWDIIPDSTSSFLIADSTWQFGASGNVSPVQFTIPNREGTVLDISGRAANVRDEECAYELSLLTPWRIQGASGPGSDGEVPSIPTFGLEAIGQGAVNCVAVAFAPESNTASINTGTLTLHYWDELSGPSSVSVVTAIAANDSSVTLQGASLGVGDLFQIEEELLQVQTITSGQYQVGRAVYGTTAAAHAANTLVYQLQSHIAVMPFAFNFFGSEASGSYAYTTLLPDARIAGAELFVTNPAGNSPVAQKAFTDTQSSGLRTLSGGQISLQIDGMLAVQTNAVPTVVMQDAHSIWDIFAVVQTAPTGSAITLQVTTNGVALCTLTIPPNSLVSNVVDGFPLGPVPEKAQIGLSITAVPPDQDDLPGSDLTVTIRL